MKDDILDAAQLFTAVRLDVRQTPIEVLHKHLHQSLGFSWVQSRDAVNALRNRADTQDRRRAAATDWEVFL